MQTGLPVDSITQLFPGADIGHIPAENLMRIDGITNAKDGKKIRSNIIHPGSTILARAPPDAVAHGHPLPFLVGFAVETSSHMARGGSVVVVWY